MINDARWGGEGRSLAAGQTVERVAYEKWLAGLPAAPEITQTWGEPPGNLMVEQGQLLIPALEFGKVLVGVQPARGHHHDPDKISHDRTLPPHHQYVAFYRWLEEAWRPDVMVHVGTHGTLEFLKGKEVGLSRTCWPEILLGNVPHLYIYHAVNASEATIAKRRSLAVLVTYNSPSFAASGLYDDYAVLDDRIAEYYEAQGLDPGRAERLARTIREQAQALNRGLRTRLLNPKWIDELLKHDFHGAQKISDRVEYLLGFAATTHAVENWVFSAVTQRYVLDEEMFQRLAANNRFAAEAILKRLAEAAQRGYWDAPKEEMQALRERYLELEGLIEGKIDP